MTTSPSAARDEAAAGTPSPWKAALLVSGVALWIALVLLPSWLAGQATLPLQKIRLPPGFRIEVYASGLSEPRSMTLGAKGTVFVGSRMAGNVYAVVDRNGDHKADRVVTIARGLQMPNGVAFREGALYVAEISRVWRFDGIEDSIDRPAVPTKVYDGYPTEDSHGWKFIGFGPDGWLYVPVGAPCNICNAAPRDPRFASITRLHPDGSGVEVFASGVRNSVGFDWHPETKELWFTDNGRDMMGDDVPPDEMNVAPRKGLHFGYPFCHGGDVPDPEFGAGRPCTEFTPPAGKMGAHVAALGMRFYTGAMFPREYRHQVFVAEHGSWNRSTPAGYRVMIARIDGRRVTSYEPFAHGWLEGGEAWGRPVDVLVLPDGSLLVSDDKADVIYRVSYEESAR